MINRNAVMPIGFECMQRVPDRTRLDRRAFDTPRAAGPGHHDPGRGDERTALLLHVLRQDSVCSDGPEPTTVDEVLPCHLPFIIHDPPSL